MSEEQFVTHFISKFVFRSQIRKPSFERVQIPNADFLASFAPTDLAWCVGRASSLMTRTAHRFAFLCWAGIVSTSILAQEPTNSEPKDEQSVASTPATRLIECPDCLAEVSRRAISCPHCGCPGSAIAEAVTAAEQAARPLPVLCANSDKGSGHALVIEENGTSYALLDSRLLAGAETLSLSTINGRKAVSYIRLEAASDAGLVRLAITPQEQGFARLLPAASAESKPAALLSQKGKLTTENIDPNANQLPSSSLASLDADGRVIAIALTDPAKTDSERRPVTLRQKWIPVSPADYRTQTALLLRLDAISGNTALSPSDRASLERTAWATPYLKKAAAALLRRPSQP